MNDILNLSEYRDWLIELKRQIKTQQIKAALSVNSHMITFYFDLGRQIVDKQDKAKWGSGFMKMLSRDLMQEFPDMTGFSLRNLRFIKQWYLFYKQLITDLSLLTPTNTSNRKQLVSHFNQTLNSSQFLQTQAKLPDQLSALALIPWGHHIKILQKIKDVNIALFYISKTIENNWSRAVLEYQIEIDLYGRQGKAVTNFNLTLPAPQSDLANALMKDPYNFDFLQLSEKVKETELEKALIIHISQFLPELGLGFAYLGRQFNIKVGSDDFRTDLLFYHTRLKSYIIIELKTTAFQPEFIGKLNFYITAIDELVKDERDNPTIGILLCKSKNNYTVEFSLKKISSPIGVSAYHYTELSDDIKAALPSAEELQNELINFENELIKT